MILDKILKEKEAKQFFTDLSVCKNCGRKMVDNTFKHGSRVGGSFNCVCGNKIFF